MVLKQDETGHFWEKRICVRCQGRTPLPIPTELSISASLRGLVSFAISAEDKPLSDQAYFPSSDSKSGIDAFTIFVTLCSAASALLEAASDFLDASSALTNAASADFLCLLASINCPQANINNMEDNIIAIYCGVGANILYALF
jgi:hypothetical protein